jgi:hypothetical protein
LEVGFYDFRITDRLREKIGHIVSVDLPRPVARQPGCSVAFASIQNLPFRNRVFDIVICTEVLEHLPDAVLVEGVQELQRVSRKYILVSVPYRQRVWNEMFKCAECGSVTNCMGHLHYMDERRLIDMFAGASPERIEFIGRREGYGPDWLYAAARRWGRVWDDHQFGPCPSCGKTTRAVKPNLIGEVLQRIIWRVQRAAEAHPAWVLMVFRVTG